MTRTAKLIRDRQETLKQGRRPPNKRYSDKFRATALLLVEASQKTSTDGKIIEVSKHLGMPYKTLRNWVNLKQNPVDEETMDETRKELAQLVDLEIREVFKEMREARAGASYRDLAIAFGIMFDKQQLLNGQSTENVQQSVTFVRQGLSSLPEHLTRGAIEDNRGEE